MRKIKNLLSLVLAMAFVLLLMLSTSYVSEAKEMGPEMEIFEREVVSETYEDDTYSDAADAGAGALFICILSILVSFGLLYLVILLLVLNMLKGKKVKRMNGAMATLVSLMDEETEEEVSQYVNRMANIIEELNQGPIAEYHRKIGIIERHYNPQIQKVKGLYDAEINRAHKMHDSAGAQSLAAQKQAEMHAIYQEMEAEKKTLKSEYREVFEARKKAKKYKKDGKALQKAFKNAKKKKSDVLNFDELFL